MSERDNPYFKAYREDKARYRELVTIADGDKKALHELVGLNDYCTRLVGEVIEVAKQDPSIETYDAIRYIRAKLWLGKLEDDLDVTEGRLWRKLEKRVKEFNEKKTRTELASSMLPVTNP